MPEIVFWGGTGHARVLAEAIAGTDLRLTAVFDNRPVPPPLPDIPILLGDAGFAQWLADRSIRTIEAASFAVAIGGGHGKARLERSEFLKARGLTPVSILHPRAWVATDATIGEGGQILAGALIATHARLGRQCIVNTGASVDHDGQLGDGVHIGPGAVLAGEVIVEACAFVGAGAIVLPRIRIGAGAVVGAGSVVTRDVAPGSVVVGNPARPVSSAAKS